MGYAAIWGDSPWSMHKLIFVRSKDFNALIPHLKLSVIMPIDQNHHQNTFSGDKVEQRGMLHSQRGGDCDTSLH